MKKIIALLLALAFVFSFSACGESSPSEPAGTEKPGTVQEQNTEKEPENSVSSDIVVGYFE